MDISILGTLFEQGGWTLVIFALFIWTGKTLYIKLSAKFDELNDKVDELHTQVTDLKVESTKWRVIVESCGREDCPNKRFLGGGQ